jgi:hypothetical protein
MRGTKPSLAPNARRGGFILYSEFIHPPTPLSPQTRDGGVIFLFFYPPPTPSSLAHPRPKRERVGISLRLSRRRHDPSTPSLTLFLSECFLLFLLVADIFPCS